MKQGIDHCGEEEMAPLSPTDRRKQRRRIILRMIKYGILVSKRKFSKVYL